MRNIFHVLQSVQCLNVNVLVLRRISYTKNLNIEEGKRLTFKSELQSIGSCHKHPLDLAYDVFRITEIMEENIPRKLSRKNMFRFSNTSKFYQWEGVGSISALFLSPESCRANQEKASFPSSELNDQEQKFAVG